MKYIVRPGEATGEHQLGAKAAALAVMQVHGLPVPSWFVLVPEAFSVSWVAVQTPDRAANTAELAVLPCDEVLEELRGALATLSPQGEPVAVRSSATDEDGAQHSFAGQYDSFLSVSASDVPSCVAGVWQSGMSERVRRYRAECSLDGPGRMPAVLIQRMVDAEFAGVAFSADPVSGRRGIAIVEAVSGLGAALATGSSDADRLSIDRHGRIVAQSSRVTSIAPDPAHCTIDGGRRCTCQPGTGAFARVVR